MNKKLCKCGCGNPIILMPHHKYVGVPDFIRGHSSRCMTPEQLHRRSISAKKRTEEGRNNNFVGCRKGKKKTDEQKKKQSESMKGKNLGKKRPEHRKIMIEIARQDETWGLKNPKLKAIVMKNRPIFSGKNNGRYIDGRTNMPGYAAQLESKKRARKRKQTPPDADFIKILSFYNKAKLLTIATGEQYDVDHIIPLSKGGLHHENNMRVITHIENIHKNNKILDIMAKEST